jgi:hypothetical protein
MNDTRRNERGGEATGNPGRKSAPRRLLSVPGSLLPPETRTHARASARAGFAALRSLADGASDLTERAIDRLSLLLSRR